jgi:hypothetical protein
MHALEHAFTELPHLNDKHSHRQDMQQRMFKKNGY